MNNKIVYHDGIAYQRVNKRKAQRLYLEGKTIYTQCCKMKLFSVWTAPAQYKKEQWEGTYYNSFENHVNAFEYYNCNSETGNHAVFYAVEEKEKAQ